METNGRRSPSCRRIIVETWGDFTQLSPRLLPYDVLFKILYAAALGPLTTWLLTTLIGSTGAPVIGNTAIAAFILSPIGIVTTIAIGTLTRAAGFIEKSGLMVIGLGHMTGQRMSFLRTVRFTARRIPNLLGLALLQTLILLIAVVPFGALGGIGYLTLLSQHNINYYLTLRPPEFQVAVALAAILAIGLLAVMAYLYLRWLFAVPAVVLEGRSFPAALGRSRELMKGGYRRCAAVMLTWGVLMVVLTAIVTEVVHALSQALFALAGHSLDATIVVSGLMLAVSVLLTAVVSFFGVSGSSLLIIRLYSERRAAEGLPLPRLPEIELQETPAAGKRRFLSRPLVWIGAAALLLLTGMLSVAMIEALDLDTDVLITAHRGYSTVAPENTVSAIDKAIEAGADMAEIDVQETADGVVVVIHDDDLMRIAGVSKSIWESDYDEIKDLDVGSWFSPEFAGERLPTLAEAVDAAQGKIKLMVELKYNGHDQRLAERTVQILAEKDFASQAVIHTLNYDGGIEAKTLDPRLQIGYIAAVVLGDVSKVDYDFLSLEQTLATPDTIDAAHDDNKAVAVWTVDDHDAMVTMINRGVDNIITDQPELLKEVRQEMSGLSDVERVLLMFGDMIED